MPLGDFPPFEAFSFSFFLFEGKNLGSLFFLEKKVSRFVRQPLFPFFRFGEITFLFWVFFLAHHRLSIIFLARLPPPPPKEETLSCFLLLSQSPKSKKITKFILEKMHLDLICFGSCFPCCRHIPNRINAMQSKGEKGNRFPQEMNRRLTAIEQKNGKKRKRGKAFTKKRRLFPPPSSLLLTVPSSQTISIS